MRDLTVYNLTHDLGMMRMLMKNSIRVFAAPLGR